MNESATPKRLSSLDWFGLISGVIGLIVDVIALASIAYGLTAGTLESNALVLSFIAFVSVFYTAVIVGFYTRRLFCTAGRQKMSGSVLTQGNYEKIDTAALTVTFVVGAPLAAATAVMLSVAVRSTFPFLYPDNSARGLYSANLFVALMGGALLPMLAYYVSSAIYKGFDLEYSTET